MTTVQNRLWRTMFHVLYMNQYGEIFVSIPGWDSNLAVRISMDNVTPEMQGRIVADGRYHGVCALGADNYEDLNIMINEDSLPIDPNDGLGN
jgi:hypothetical protein